MKEYSNHYQSSLDHDTPPVFDRGGKNRQNFEIVHQGIATMGGLGRRVFRLSGAKVGTNFFQVTNDFRDTVPSRMNLAGRL